MPYFEAFTLAASGVAYADYTYNLTSIYDPNVTGTGHQPRFADQWALLYQSYRVRSTYVRVDCRNSGADATTGNQQIVGTCISDFSAGSTNLEDIIESPYANAFLKNHWKSIQHAGISVETNWYRRRTRFDIDRLRTTIYPTSGQLPEAVDLWTTFGSSPAAYNIYFNFYSGNYQAAIDTNTDIDCAIKIIYEVELGDPVFQSPS